ncbi:YihY/virulence factor BrkB family protein [Luedemannella flava]
MLARLLAHGPSRPGELSWRSWWHALRRTVLEFLNDDLTDRAAALTYYGIQSIFPGMLVLVSLLGLIGGGTTQEVLDNIEDMTPGPLREFLTTGIAGCAATRAWPGSSRSWVWWWRSGRPRPTSRRSCGRPTRSTTCRRGARCGRRCRSASPSRR